MHTCPSQTPNWHGHVTAVTCAPTHRRLGLAAKLMSALEEISEKKHCFFVDLFVRVSNKVAINMYKALGYTIYRKVFTSMLCLNYSVARQLCRKVFSGF